jgi:hypothetical protein
MIKLRVNDKKNIWLYLEKKLFTKETLSKKYVYMLWLGDIKILELLVTQSTRLVVFSIYMPDSSTKLTHCQNIPAIMLQRESAE